MSSAGKPAGGNPSGKKNIVNFPWANALLKTPSGRFDPCVENVIVALRQAPELRGLLRYNSFAQVIDLAIRPPWESGKDEWKPRLWSDRDEILLTAWLQRLKIGVGVSTVADGVHVVAQDASYHPVREYLEALKWDAIPRLVTWLNVYLGALPSPYHEAIGPRWMVACVARIMEPGPNCKAENVLILEGLQGLLKSTALRTLAVNGAWFIDDLRRFGGREPAMQLAGRWIVELAELTAMNDVTIEACKGFLSQNTDNYRPPYARRSVEVARQCVFAASTNKNVFLRDETGDRRYWPVTCERTDIAALLRDRDQLWAEALQLYKQEYKWWLDTPELRALAESAQAARFDADPWEMTIKEWLSDKKITTPEQILTDKFLMEIQAISKSHRNRVSAILRHLLWKRVHATAQQEKDLSCSYVWIPTS